MNISRSMRHSALLALTALVCACASNPRPAAPQAGDPVEFPWGAVPHISDRHDSGASLSNSLVSSLEARLKRVQVTAPDGKIPYRALALSGGGSRGAYGAGVMTGWTERGDRPEFDVVTGISTGALMATHIFLGPEFDDDLGIYKRMTNADVYKRRGILGITRAGGAFNTEPLRDTLHSIIDEHTLDLVAAEHSAGRRLFVGSTNLDANLFTIWDMGAIASSGRPDRLTRYIDVLMASAAFPIAFQPVYIEVEGKNGTYTQMHADGGIRETAFYFDFLDELYAAAARADLNVDNFHQEFYLLINGSVSHSSQVLYQPVSGRLKDVTGATIQSLMHRVTRGSVFRLWVQAMMDGSDFHLSFIPEDFEFSTHALEFKPEESIELFELGYRQSIEGRAWATQLAPRTREEMLERIRHPASKFDVQDRHRSMMDRGGN